MISKKRKRANENKVNVKRSSGNTSTKYQKRDIETSSEYKKHDIATSSLYHHHDIEINANSHIESNTNSHIHFEDEGLIESETSSLSECESIYNVYNSPKISSRVSPCKHTNETEQHQVSDVPDQSDINIPDVKDMQTAVILCDIHSNQEDSSAQYDECQPISEELKHLHYVYQNSYILQRNYHHLQRNYQHLQHNHQQMVQDLVESNNYLRINEGHIRDHHYYFLSKHVIYENMVNDMTAVIRQMKRERDLYAEAIMTHDCCQRNTSRAWQEAKQFLSKSS